MTTQSNTTEQDASSLVAARKEKLRRWREDLGVQPYGHRVDDLISLADARSCFDTEANNAWTKSQEDGEAIDDPRPTVAVAGRCVQHRAMGKLVFMVLRDHSGDLQVSISKQDLEGIPFKLASKLDYGDIVVARGPMGMTKKGEICVWANDFQVHCKSLAPPPEKFHGLTDQEARYRRRYVDMYANQETMGVFYARSRIVSCIRRFMEHADFVEVETPMMQPIAGGAAARPFSTHHNALDIDLFMRIAPELYLKRLLVGGMPRVFELNRNFRNEGVDRRHNPEFTMLEAYQAFGDYDTVLVLTESMLKAVASELSEDGSLERPYGEITIDWSKPFVRQPYAELVQQGAGVDMHDEAAVRAAAAGLGMEDAETKDHWLLVEELFEAKGEPAIDPSQPTFVIDYPSAVSPLSRPHEDTPTLAYRSELFIGGMELGNFYTELNDPAIQESKFTEQLVGADDEANAFRSMDHDFIESLRVGMPPAGGFGLGIDRVVMLMTNCTSIRDVILFPLMRPE
jgi:lysyl-tRNA synthetase class 2